MTASPSSRRRGRPAGTGKPSQPCGECHREGGRRYRVGELRVCSTCKSRHDRQSKNICDVRGCSGTVSLGKNREQSYCRSHEDRYLTDNPDGTASAITYLGQAIVDLGNGCWEYVGADNRDHGTDRPQVWCAGLRWYVARFLYIRFFGPHKGGLELHHLCGRGTCVNPAHLRPLGPVTNKGIESKAWKWAWQRTVTKWSIGHSPRIPSDPDRAVELSEFTTGIPVRPILRRDRTEGTRPPTFTLAQLLKAGRARMRLRLR